MIIRYRRVAHRLRPLAICLTAVAVLALAPPPVDEKTTRVPAGANLQEAIDRARPGDTLVLAAGATYVGNFVLPPTSGDAYITIRTEAGSDLPAAGQRVGPEHAARLANLQSPNKQPVLATRQGAHHWRLLLLAFLPTSEGFGDIITLGDGGTAQTDRATVPHSIVVDRCYIRGDAVKGQKRGIALNSGSTVITGSYITDMKAKGMDAQAIAGWNGPGPYTIENNYLEGAGENFILGGGDPAIKALITEDVIFRNNHLAKPLDWRGQGWQVKNLFELKNARRVLVEGNLMEHVWSDAQAGYAVLFTPRNQDGGAPWAVVEDVTFRRNIVRHAGAGIQITGEDTNHPSGRTRRIMIADNLFYGIDGKQWGGAGAFLLIGDGPDQVSVERNTISQSGNILSAFGGTAASPKPITRFVFRANVVRHNAYGVHGADRAVGRDTLKAFFPDAVFQGNSIAGGDPRRYPDGNSFIDDGEFEGQFVDSRAGDFRLRPGSRLRGGANVEAILKIVGNVATGARRPAR